MADFLLKYWPLITAAAALIGGGAVGEWRLSTVEESVKAQQTQAEAIHSIEIEQATITAQQEAIRAQVEDLNDDAKANQAILIQILQKVQ